MIPAGYMAKRICEKPDWLSAAQVIDVYSVSGCISKDFADYIRYWKHNGYWFFDSPKIILDIAKEDLIPMEGTSLFYYEVHEVQFDGKSWNQYRPEPSFSTNVVRPSRKRIKGFDVATFSVGSGPECSPLSCNGLAKEIPTNRHCLFDSFDEAETNVNDEVFTNSEPGPYRIFSVYSVDWPKMQ